MNKLNEIIYEISKKDVLFNTSFGYYCVDTSRAEYHDINYCYVDKVNEELIDVLENNEFYYIILNEELKNKFNVDKEVCYLMEFTTKLELENTQNIEIIKLTSEYLEQYAKFSKFIQELDFKVCFNPVTKRDLTFDYYLILKDDKIIGFFQYIDEKIIESVYILKEYRQKGIMSYALNSICKSGAILNCDSDVVKFYENSGFKIYDKYNQYTIKNTTENLEIFKKLI